MSELLSSRGEGTQGSRKDERRGRRRIKEKEPRYPIYLEGTEEADPLRCFSLYIKARARAFATGKGRGERAFVILNDASSKVRVPVLFRSEAIIRRSDREKQRSNKAGTSPRNRDCTR